MFYNFFKNQQIKKNITDQGSASFHGFTVAGR